MIPTPGQSAFAHAASARLDAGDDDGRVVADLLTVVSAMISDMPDIRSRRAHYWPSMMCRALWHGWRVLR